MKYLLFFSLTISAVFIGCNTDEKSSVPKFDIDLPQGYIIEGRNQGYNLLSASKYENEEIVGTIEIRYSDDYYGTWRSICFLGILQNCKMVKA